MSSDIVAEKETRIGLYKLLYKSGASPEDAARAFELVKGDNEDLVKEKLAVIRQLDLLVSKGKSCTYADKRTGLMKEKYRYVSFEDIIKAYEPSLKEHGLALDFFSDSEPVGSKIIVRVQARASLVSSPISSVTSGNFSGIISYGQNTPESSEFVQYQKSPGFSESVKDYGSLLSYLKRYALIYLLSVKTTEARDVEQIPGMEARASQRIKDSFAKMPADRKKDFRKKYKCTEAKTDSFLATIEATDPELAEYIFSFSNVTRT